MNYRQLLTLCLCISITGFGFFADPALADTKLTQIDYSKTEYTKLDAKKLMIFGEIISRNFCPPCPEHVSCSPCALPEGLYVKVIDGDLEKGKDIFIITPGEISDIKDGGKYQMFLQRNTEGDHYVLSSYGPM